VALTAVIPASRVAKQLRLRLADLKQQIATRQASPPAVPYSPTSLGFVEVPLPPARPQAPSTIQVELHRTDGSRLCIHVAASTLPLDTLVRTFLEGQACCS
jgi:hypothetical protein